MQTESLGERMKRQDEQPDELVDVSQILASKSCTGIVDSYFFVDTKIHKNCVYLIGAYLRFLKDKGYEYVDNSKIFFIDPTAFRYLRISTTFHNYEFTEYCDENDTPISLENNWNLATEKITGE